MSNGPSRLEINLLGPLVVMVDAMPITVDTRKAVALLAYLAITDKGQSRDHLVDLFWPESDPDRARATLRRTLSALRSGLSDRWVQADRSTVWLEADDGVSVDVERIRAALGDTHDHGPDQVCPRCIESLTGAASQVRGPFMEGFFLRGCPDFDDWMVGEAEHQRRAVSSLFERLSTALSGQGRYPEAIEAVRRWLEVDPLLEQAHRMLMLFHAWSGDRSGAVDAYRSWVALLDQELGVDPLDETTELYEAILEEDLPRAPAPPRRLELTTQGSPEPTGYQLVGRNEELEALAATVKAGHGLVIIEGEVGVGKTRLIRELGDMLTPTDGLVLTAEAHRSETAVAYGPIQAVLRSALDVPDVAERWSALPGPVIAEVARLVPELGEHSVIDPGDSAARTRFLDAISLAIGAVSDEVVLCIDNLHWLDASSLELVGYLARRLERLGVVLVLTRRPEDTPIDHPVSVLVEDLSSDAHVIRLDRLGREEVAELIEMAGVSDVDPGGVYDRTRGLPFFVVEYLDAARAGRTDLPAAVRRLVLSRLTDLGALARQLLTAAAVIGPVVDPEMLRSVSGRSEDEVVGGLDLLLRRALLEEREDGLLGFAHEQLREVANEEASQPRRRLLHRRSADYLASRPGSDTDLRTLDAAIRHHRAAGNDAEASRLSLAAGSLAVDVFAFEEAVHHYETALALGAPDRADVLYRIGDVRTLMGDYGAALTAYEAARSILRITGAHRETALVARAIGEVYRRLRRWDMAAASFEEAYGELADDDALGSAVAADWAFVEHCRGDQERARQYGGLALDGASASGDPEVLAHAHNLAGLLAEDATVRIDHLEQALVNAASPSARAAVLNNLALASASTGDLESAMARGRDALETAAEAGDRHRTAALHDNLADYLHRAGEEEQAMEELKKAVALFAEVGLEPGELVPEVWLLKEW